MAESITVPGVMIRLISRFRIPFVVFGSPTCSQTATLYPFPTSFAIYPSAAWYGTPARGMRLSPLFEREVRTISSSREMVSASLLKVS